MARPKNERPVTHPPFPSNGWWVSFVPVGTGKPRRKRSAKMCASCQTEPDTNCACYKRCVAKVRELEDQVTAKKIPQVGGAQTLEEFLARWIEDKAEHLEYQTIVSYRKCIRRLAPIFDIPVPDLTTDGISDLLRAITRQVSASEAARVLRVLRSALADYERVHPDVRSMARLVKPPRVKDKEVVPLSLEEAHRVLAIIERRRTKARWQVGIALGLRQGEALAQTWSRPDKPGDIDLIAGVLTVREKQYRRKWEHGCADPHACGARLHRMGPCSPGCRHQRACPPPCSKTCVAHASSCPQRHSGGLVKGEPKNGKRRSVALPPTVLASLREWKAQQEQERAAAGSKWVDSGRVFTDPFGRPVDAKRDWDEWKAILIEAGVPHRRVHDGRHTAATLNQALDIDPRTRQEIMGWSSQKMQERYEHPVTEMKRDAANRMDALLWPATAVLPPDDGPGSATAAATADGAKILQFRRKAV